MAQKIDPELTEAEAALLMAVTSEAMGDAGALGASLGQGPFRDPWSERSGAAGGRFGARFTRPRSAAAVVEVTHDPAAVREQATAAIAAGGVVIDDPNAAGDGSIWGVVRSGALDMAPALVRVQVDTTGAGGSRVRVRATGREGLIKQRIAAKAVDRLCEAVSRST